MFTIVNYPEESLARHCLQVVRRRTLGWLGLNEFECQLWSEQIGHSKVSSGSETDLGLRLLNRPVLAESCLTQGFHVCLMSTDNQAQ